MLLGTLLRDRAREILAPAAVGFQTEKTCTLRPFVFGSTMNEREVAIGDLPGGGYALIFVAAGAILADVSDLRRGGHDGRTLSLRHR
jgi:hypothetical protein